MGDGTRRWPERGAWVHLLMALSDCVKETRLGLEELDAHSGRLPLCAHRSVGLLRASEEALRQAAYELERAMGQPCS